jgi:hypothetical protein
MLFVCWCHALPGVPDILMVSRNESGKGKTDDHRNPLTLPLSSFIMPLMASFDRLGSSIHPMKREMRDE